MNYSPPRRSDGTIQGLRQRLPWPKDRPFRILSIDGGGIRGIDQSSAHPILPIPDDPRVRHLGFVSERDKFDGIAASSLLVMPSYYESLSMVALEAWGLGRPVLANGRCDVLRGQCVRSNAGLYYETYAEFAAALACIERDRDLAASLGRNGREFFCRHYTWPVIEGKYLDMLRRLQDEDESGRRKGDGGGREAGGRRGHAIEPLPGWFARRRQTLRPAREIIDAVPQGPVTRNET